MQNLLSVWGIINLFQKIKKLLKKVLTLGVPYGIIISNRRSSRNKRGKGNESYDR